MDEASYREEWRRIAEEITRETDPEKLMQLVQQLIDSYDSRPKERTQPPTTESPRPSRTRANDKEGGETG